MTIRKAKIQAFCAVLSIFTTVAFHIPFFSHAAENIESGFNGWMILASLALLMLVLNYFMYYLILWLGRGAGRCILAFFFLANALSLYFINTYDVMLDASMMGNVFNTQYSEASGFFSLSGVLYVLLLGVFPCIYIFARKIDYGSGKLMGLNSGISLGIILAVVFGNMTNWPWMDRNSTVLGSLILPWSYTVNSVRFKLQERERKREEIRLPDAVFEDEEKSVCVLVIGESARRDHFSLYGYERRTNPLLEGDGVTALIAESAATYTTGGVKAILDHKPSDKLYEILPNYLFRAGADVVWRTSNWGEPPVHFDRYYGRKELKEFYPEADDNYDGILFEGLGELVASSQKNKVLVVIHTSTSHGPLYNKHYPASFEQFKPVCETVEMSKADPAELMNSYDNSILYTDFLVHRAIEELRSLPEEWRRCMLFVSDHGESLGEGNLYMHGVPMSIAPKEQLEIPFVVWSPDAQVKALEKVGQYHVFHSVLHFLGARSDIYNEAMNIFE